MTSRTEGVHASPISVLGGEQEQLILCAGRCHHFSERVGFHVVPVVVGVLEEGCHQGIPISAPGVFGVVCE